MTLIMIYLVIFAGGLVRAAGAGLGCPDWPRCFDRWIPPTSLDQLPAYIDPGSFNITLAWIDYSNRLAGVLGGIFVLILAGWSLIYIKRERWIPLIAFSVLFLTITEGWLGALLVKSHLQPGMISLHLLLALVIVSLLVFLCLRLRLPPVTDSSKTSPTMIAMTIFLGVIILANILLGTELRGGLEQLAIEQPLNGKALWLQSLSPVKYIHSAVGILLFLGGLLLWPRRNQFHSTGITIIEVLIPLLVGLLALQTVLGEIMILAALPQLMRLLHMWLATIIWGLIVAVFSIIIPFRGKQNE